MIKSKVLSVIGILITMCLNAQEIRDSFTHNDLEKWSAYGLGKIEANHKQTVMWEEDGAVGYMLVSPKSYSGDVMISYDIMAMNAASVLIVELNAHDSSDFDLDIPSDYDGNVKYLFENVNMYMFAFHNAAHNKQGPFVRKWPKPGATPLKAAKQNVLEVGKYHHIELGIKNGFLYFKADGKRVFKVKDESPYEGGRVILRIRGTAQEMASCIIKNLEITASDAEVYN